MGIFSPTRGCYTGYELNSKNSTIFQGGQRRIAKGHLADEERNHQPHLARGRHLAGGARVLRHY